MNETTFFWILLTLEFIAIPFVAIFLFRNAAMYGRYQQREGINATIGWFLMEIPAVVSFGISYLVGRNAFQAIPLIFFIMWQTHYIYRTFLFTLKLKPQSKTIPLSIIFMAFFYNLMNGYLNGRYLTEIGPEYQLAWLTNPKFIIGIILFFIGMAINRNADQTLLKIKQQGKGYRVPEGRLFNFISCPNYFGEIIEWFGWAIATWSLPGLGFALFTAANLIPRAFSHHIWYKKHFPHYPKKRKAVLPFIF